MSKEKVYRKQCKEKKNTDKNPQNPNLKIFKTSLPNKRLALVLYLYQKTMHSVIETFFLFSFYLKFSF